MTSLGPLSELKKNGEVQGDDYGEGKQELGQAGYHGVGHPPLALPRVLAHEDVRHVR